MQSKVNVGAKPGVRITARIMDVRFDDQQHSYATRLPLAGCHCRGSKHCLAKAPHKPS